MVTSYTLRLYSYNTYGEGYMLTSNYGDGNHNIYIHITQVNINFFKQSIYFFIIILEEKQAIEDRMI